MLDVAVKAFNNAEFLLKFLPQAPAMTSQITRPIFVSWTQHDDILEDWTPFQGRWGKWWPFENIKKLPLSHSWEICVLVLYTLRSTFYGVVKV